MSQPDCAANHKDAARNLDVSLTAASSGTTAQDDSDSSLSVDVHTALVGEPSSVCRKMKFAHVW